VEIEIHEDRNREVRGMFEALGYFIDKLIRVRIGKSN
jgi:16S rRNA U516 pseudouridylate synthase RsuA-like enzyme